MPSVSFISINNLSAVPYKTGQFPKIIYNILIQAQLENSLLIMENESILLAYFLGILLW